MSTALLMIGVLVLVAYSVWIARLTSAIDSNSSEGSHERVRNLDPA